MREIKLTRGKVALVSSKDFDFLNQWKWYAQPSKSGIWYAVRAQYLGMVDGKKKQKSILMHRVILARKLGHEDFENTDHQDGNGLNNLRSNLRPSTHKQNCENRRGAQKNSKSGVRGVSWHKGSGKWRVKIGHHGKHIYLGYFDDIIEAEAAVIAARNELFTHCKD